MPNEAIGLSAPINSVASATTRLTSAAVLAVQSFLDLKPKNCFATIPNVGPAGAGFASSPGIGGKSTVLMPANQGSWGAVAWYSPASWAANILVLSILALR